MEKIVILVGLGEVGKALMKSDKGKHQTFGVDINLPASFADVAQDGGSIRVQPATDPTAADLPPLTVRVYNRSASKHTSVTRGPQCSRTSHSTNQTRF
jgi:hypothetical protein